MGCPALTGLSIQRMWKRMLELLLLPVPQCVHMLAMRYSQRPPAGQHRPLGIMHLPSNGTNKLCALTV